MSTKSIKWAEAAARARAARARMSPDEDAAITAAAQSDPDNPPLTDEVLAQLRLATADELTAIKRARGHRGLGKKPAKEQVSLRLDPDVLSRFKAEGPGWQRRINDALRSLAFPAPGKTSGGSPAGDRVPGRRRVGRHRG